MGRIEPERWAGTVFPGVEVSTLGRLRNAKTGALLKATPNSRRYPSVVRHVDGRVVSRTLHRMVLEAFVGPRPEGLECRHLNGDRSDARLSNLQWGTHAENMQDRERHGMGGRRDGQHNGRAVVRLGQVDRIRAWWKCGVNQLIIAERFGISRSQVQNIVHRRQWR